MGFHFAHLLAYSQSLRTASSSLDESIIAEMIHLSKTIINLAIETADERTRHLTDHIYHIVAFSALTLTRILHTYGPRLQALSHDTVALDQLVVLLVDWLRSIGLQCHVARLLSQILLAQFKKLRPDSLSDVTTNESDLRDTNGEMSAGGDEFDLYIASLFPEIIESELLNINASAAAWPRWNST